VTTIGRKEETEAVEMSPINNDDYKLTCDVRLPVLETLPDIFYLELFSSGTELHICMETTNDKDS
jgi:hypothetical protein